jgi:hypothetical protein
VKKRALDQGFETRFIRERRLRVEESFIEVLHKKTNWFSYNDSSLALQWAQALKIIETRVLRCGLCFIFL